MKHRLIVCSLAVAFLLAGTRWASYAGIAPLFVSDVLLLLAFIGSVVATMWQPRAAQRQDRLPGRYLLSFIVFYSLMRFLLGDFSVLAARDFAPYLYIGVALIAGASLHRTDREGVDRTGRLFMGVLWFHVAWFLVSTFYSIGFVPPGFSVTAPIFSPRPDVDSAVNAVFVGVLLLRILRGRARASYVLGVIAATIPIVVIGSRAGVLTLGFAVLLVFFVVQNAASRQRRLTLLLIALIASLGAVSYLPQTEAGQRLAGTFGPGAVSSDGSAQAAGTTRARVNAWSTLTRWNLSSDSRTVLGVGFGPNFMQESGAIVKLVGRDSLAADSVRSPHSYVLGTWTRLGLVGLLPIVLVTGLCLRSMWRGRHNLATSETRVLAALILVTYAVVALVGVVLESPFGAIPFWWSVGVTLAWSSRDAVVATGRKLEPEMSTSSPQRLELDRRPIRAGS